MNTASRRMIGSCTLVLVPLLAGAASDALPFTGAFSLRSPDGDGSVNGRLVIEAAGLLVLWMSVGLAALKLPDNGRGASFLRKILFPLASVFVLIILNSVLRLDERSIIGQIGPQRYALGYAAGLIVSALWMTTAWWLNREALRRVFAGAYVSPQATPPTIEPAGDSRPDVSDAEPVNDGNSLPPRTIGTPATLGRYRILKELGRGAMGIVYLGKDPTIQRFVAIKTMSLDPSEDAEQLQEEKARFFREAESTGRLSHPNIVTIYDAGEEQGLVYLAMEMLEGTTLKHWSRKPNLMPLNHLIPVFAAVADALDYAHQQGIIHRDIKPANIMVTNQQSVKVMDFGVAKIASTSKTHSDVVLGTPTYMSPEQLSGKHVDGRSDIFSLGVVLYELLAGRPPFIADNVPALLYAIANTPHPSLSTIRTDLPPALIQLVDRALHKNVAHRYRRAAELAQALRACAQVRAA
jgi:serine/threonine-protein kinase